jgi:hypothetical protein
LAQKSSELFEVLESVPAGVLNLGIPPLLNLLIREKSTLFPGLIC